MTATDFDDAASPMREVVAVIASAGAQAGCARSLSAAFLAAGFELRLSTHRELVAEVSLEQRPGQRPTVEPDRPLLWLSPGDPVRSPAKDRAFLASETFAAARSIATVTRSPVLNRPSALSLSGEFPAGRALAVRRARRHGLEDAVRSERFSSGWPPAGEVAHPGGQFVEVADYATGLSSYGFEPGASGPFRSRRAVPSADLVKVRVLGSRTFCTAVVADATLRASRLIVASYRLDLATVWWLIERASGAATLARIDCWPWDAAFDPSFDTVAAAAAAWMSERLEHAARPSR